MLTNDRYQKILELLNVQQRATIEELSELTGSSVSTLRRDLNELESNNKLRRVHGGAELIQDLSTELSMSEKSVKNVQAKQEIAETALTKLSDHDVIFLDAGTTTGAMIAGLRTADLILTVVTPSVTHASQLLLSDKLTVYILGGRIKKTTDTMTGSDAINQLTRYRFSKAFIGANGFDEKHGVTTPDVDEAAVKGLAIKQSEKSYLLVDKSKLGQTSFAKFAEAEELEVITNQ